MTEGTLFNPGFLGEHFKWWIGQIPDDSYWRSNINPETFKTKQEIPGWGYRYKVRIIGLHDREEEYIPSDQLPWAQVMYPVTAGGGQGGSMQTPNIRQGMFVFGFFLDGADQQVPVIMGVLGNNSQTKLASTIGINSSNYAGTSGVANRTGNDGKGTGKSTPEVPDHNLTRNQPPPKTKPTEEAAGKNPAPVASQRQDEKLKEKITLASPCKKQNTNLKNIKVAIEELAKKLQQVNNALTRFSDAVSLKISDLTKKVENLIAEGADIVAKCLKGVYDQVKGFIQKKINELAKPFENISIPSFKIKILNLKIDAFKSISCLFTKIGEDLFGNVKDILSRLFGPLIDNIKDRFNQSLLSSQSFPSSQETLGSPATSNSNLPLTQRNQSTIATNQNPSTFGSAVQQENSQIPSTDFGTAGQGQNNQVSNTFIPTPPCTVESLVAEVLSININDITRTVDSAITPIILSISDYINSYGGDPSLSQLSPIFSKDNSINVTRNSASSTLKNSTNFTNLNDAVGTQAYVNDLGRAASALGSKGPGNLNSIVNSIASSLGIPPGFAPRVTDAIGLFKNGNIVDGFGALAQAAGLDSGVISAATSLLNGGDVVAGLSAMATSLGVDPVLVGNLASTIQSLRQGQLPNVFGIDVQGLIPGIQVDIAQAISFISSIATFFECEPEVVCPVNDQYSLYNGGSTTENPPAPSNVAKQASEK